MLAGLSDSFTVGDDSAPASTGPRASPGPGRDKSSSWIFRRVSSLRFLAYLPLLLVRAFVFPSAARPSCCSAFRLWSASLAPKQAHKQWTNCRFTAVEIGGITSRSRIAFSRYAVRVVSVSVAASPCLFEGLKETGTSTARAQIHDPVSIAAVDATHPRHETRLATTGSRPSAGRRCAGQYARAGKARA